MVSYAGKRVLVTGGLGFIGSNLSLRLVQLGADVTIVNSLVQGCGGNRRNIESIARKVNLIEADVGDRDRLHSVLGRLDMVFNLAGEISHSHSMQFPERDCTLNTRAQVSFLNECAKRTKGMRVVYAGTRQVYGRPQKLPVNESHPVAPVDFNGVHKHATEQYHLMLTRVKQLDAVILRFSNVYGPRLGIHAPCQGVFTTFFLNLTMGEPIEVFGDGKQLRDPLYVDDAVSALLLAGEGKPLKSRIYNVGGRESLPSKKSPGLSACWPAGQLRNFVLSRSTVPGSISEASSRTRL